MKRGWIKLLAGYDRIILYGAGLVGELVGNYLCANGLQRKIIGYAVSRKDQNKTSLCGFRIYGIEELKAKRNDSLVIVATLPDLHREIQKELSRLRFSAGCKGKGTLYGVRQQQDIRSFSVYGRTVWSA